MRLERQRDGTSPGAGAVRRLAVEPPYSRLDQEVGAFLLQQIVERPRLISQRREKVSFIDHQRARRHVTIDVDLGGFAGGHLGESYGAATRLADIPAPAPARRPVSLPLWRGLVLVVVAALDKSRQTEPQVLDSDGAIVATVPPTETVRLVREGLIGMTRTLGNKPPPPKIQALIRTAGSFEEFAAKVPMLDRDGVMHELLSSQVFRAAFAVATELDYIVVPVSPEGGPLRVFQFEYGQPIDLDPGRSVTRQRWWRWPQAMRSSLGQTAEAVVVVAFADAAAATHARNEVEAPFDTRFPDRALPQHGSGIRVTGTTPVEVQGANLSFQKTTGPTEEWPMPTTLFAPVMTLPTGVTRAAMYTAGFNAFVMTLGAVLFGIAGALGKAQTLEPDALTALLVLFPGLVAGVLSAPSKHPITAHLQFPTRRCLWFGGALSLGPAVTLGFGIKGMPRLSVWCLAALALVLLWYWTLKQWLRLRRCVRDRDARIVSSPACELGEPKGYRPRFTVASSEGSVGDVLVRAAGAGGSAAEDLSADLARAAAIARVRARVDFSPRFAVTYVGRDAKGTLARCARPLANRGCNVEGATMAVVADQVLATIVVSSPDTDAAGIKAALDEVARELEPKVTPLDDWGTDCPKPMSGLWHVAAECPDAPDVLHGVAALLAEHDVPLVSFATWTTRSGRFVVDVNFAVPPEVDGDDVSNRLTELLVARWGARVDSRKRVRRLTKSSVDAEAFAQTDDAVIVAVVGEADPMLVPAVTESLLGAGDGRAPYHVLGSAMSIIDGLTSLMLIVHQPGQDEPVAFSDVAHRVSEALTSFDARIAACHRYVAVRSRHPSSAPYGRGAGVATHALLCRAPEEPGVLADLAEVVADVGANIVWLAARVAPTTAAGHREVFELRLELAMPAVGESREAAADDLRARLASVARCFEWEVEVVSLAWATTRPSRGVDGAIRSASTGERSSRGLS